MACELSQLPGNWDLIILQVFVIFYCRPYTLKVQVPQHILSNQRRNLCQLPTSTALIAATMDRLSILEVLFVLVFSCCVERAFLIYIGYRYIIWRIR